jgi:hypothetical protein
MSLKTDKVESGKYSDSDSVQKKAVSPESNKRNTSYSNSSEEKKKQLLDMYLQKKITKEEYFGCEGNYDNTK